MRVWATTRGERRWRRADARGFSLRRRRFLGCANTVRVKTGYIFAYAKTTFCARAAYRDIAGALRLPSLLAPSW